ncbi:MAG TPA: hypothetical protein VM099_03535 [Gemmatimonadaceae bacterium]|nr:hypothetical protein [Gemmatimonadaceae bacterium]
MLIAKLTVAALLFAMIESNGGDYRRARLTKQSPRIMARNALRAEALGCYELLDSAGQNASKSMEGVPAIIRVDSMVDLTRDMPAGMTSLRTLGAATVGTPVYRDPISRDMHPRWSADSLTDSVRLVFTNGFTGALFALNLPVNNRGDTLKGRAKTFVDVAPLEGPEGNAWAVRRHCPKPQG